MKQRKGSLFCRFAAVAAALLVGFTGCAGGYSGSGYGQSTAAAEYAPEPAAAGDSGYDGEWDDASYETADRGLEGSAEGVSVDAASANPDRKIITTVDLYMESKEYDLCVYSIYGAIEAAGGYIEYSDINGSIQDPNAAIGDVSSGLLGLGTGLQTVSTGGDYEYDGYSSSRRYLTMKIRIPQGNLTAFLSSMERYGNVLSKQESAKDVTLEYVDIEAHKSALEAEQERLLSMLEQAETVEDMILLEQRLSNVRYQLESYERQLRAYDNQVNYATVNLTLNEVQDFTPVASEDPPTVWERISDGMQQTLNDIAAYWINLFVRFVINLPYIIPTVMIVLIVLMVLRRIIRKNRDKITKSMGKLEQKVTVTPEKGKQEGPADSNDA